MGVPFMHNFDSQELTYTTNMYWLEGYACLERTASHLRLNFRAPIYGFVRGDFTHTLCFWMDHSTKVTGRDENPMFWQLHANWTQVESNKPEWLNGLYDLNMTSIEKIWDQEDVSYISHSSTNAFNHGLTTETEYQRVTFIHLHHILDT